jgi:hypothetical protein
MKICSVGAKVFHKDRKTEGRTDRPEKLNNRFSQFCARVQKNYAPHETHAKKTEKKSDVHNIKYIDENGAIHKHSA